MEMKYLKIFEDFSDENFTKEEMENIKDIFISDVFDEQKDMNQCPSISYIKDNNGNATFLHISDLMDMQVELVQNFCKRINTLGYFTRTSFTGNRIVITKTGGGAMYYDDKKSTQL